MLTLDLNGQYFALGTGFSIRVSWRNPAMQKDKISGDAGLGITLPFNDINRAILGAPEMFAKYYPAGTQGIRFTGCSLRWGVDGGALIMAGSLVVNSATDNYDCWLQSDVGVLGEQQQKKNITEFPWPTAQTFTNKTTYDDDSDNYGVLPVFNRGFWDGIGKEVENKVNGREQTISKLQKEHFENFGYWVNATDPGVGVKLTGAGCVVSPYLHLRYVLKELLRMSGFFIGTDQMTPTGAGESLALLKNMMIYNNFNIMRANYTQVTEILPGWDQNTQSIGDAAYNVITVTSWGIAPFDYKDLLPKISLRDFLLGIQNSLNYIFRFRNDGKVDIIDRNAIPLNTAINLQPYLAGSWEMGERISRRIKFNPAVDDNDAMFGSDYEDLTDRLSDFGEPVATYAALLAIASPGVGELRLVLETNKIYEYKWFVASPEDVNYAEEQVDTFGWEFISTGTQPYIYLPENETEETIDVALTTPEKSPAGLGAYYYNVIQKGNLAQMRSTWNDFTLRCMVGNSSILFPDGINWSGTSGLMATRWNNWAPFFAGRQDAARKFNLPLNVLLYVIENITEPFRTDEGEFFIEEIECEFGLNTIGVTTIKGFK